VRGEFLLLTNTNVCRRSWDVDGALVADGIWIPLSATTVEWKTVGDSDNFTIWPSGTAAL
jgi:hypothetical protein